jgi:hypothetical protein
MNKRIQKLIEQCTTYYNGGLGTEIEVFDKEKFAELIVQECASIIESQDVDPTFRHRMSWAMKKHFGVAE